MYFLVKDCVRWGPKGWRCWKTDTPPPLARSFSTVLLLSWKPMWEESSSHTTERWFPYHVHPKCFLWRLPTPAILVGPFYGASCHRPGWLALTASGGVRLDESWTSSSPQRGCSTPSSKTTASHTGTLWRQSGKLRRAFADLTTGLDPLHHSHFCYISRTLWKREWKTLWEEVVMFPLHRVLI